MIYLFTGSDSEKVRAKAFAWVQAVRAKEPEASYIRLSADEINEQALDEVVQSQGLFYSKLLVLLDDPFAVTASGESVLAALPHLVETTNPIAILAPKLLAARGKKLEAVATKVFTIDSVEKKSVRGFNSALVNALGARDGRALWLELMKAERAGDVPEMIHGLLHWKARDILSKGNRNWNVEEARVLSLQLIELLSDSRGGDIPLPLALERFSLSLSK